MNPARKIIKVMVLACFYAANGNAATLDAATAEKAADTRIVAQRTQALKLAATNGDTASLVVEAHRNLQDASLAPAERERLNFIAALMLRQVAPSPEARQLALALSTQQPVVFVWHTEGHHKVAVPMHEVAAAAAFTLTAWQRDAAHRDAVIRLRNGPADLGRHLQSSSTSSAADLAGIEDAFRQASSASLHLWRDHLLSELPRNRRLDAITAIAAERLRDAALFAAVLRFGSDAAALSALPALSRALPDAIALQQLQNAVARDAIASAAVLATGNLARHYAPASQALFALLADVAHGGSAAAALAALDDPSIVADLAALLTSTDHAVERRRALLALRLNNSPRAMDAINRWRQQPSREPDSAALKQQAGQWLAR